MLRVDHDELSRLALSAPPGSAGLVLVPYLEGERTPNRPKATGALHGLRLANATPAHLARAAVEGLLCALADGLAQLTEHGVVARRVLLIGGGARSQALREIAPLIFGVPVLVPDPAEYVAWGLPGRPRGRCAARLGHPRGSHRQPTSTPASRHPPYASAMRRCAS